MTSSLVGSEMCIRDSPTMGTRLKPLKIALAISSCCAFGKSPRHPPGSVSYTHLTLPTICSV
eukprot:4653730-Prorocentrum_lima.AAC.1